MSIETAMAGYYAQRAAEYERIYHKPERQADLARLRDLVAEAFTGKHVLEIACGTGWWTEVISQTAASVTATDYNEEVLAVARAKPMDQSRVTFQRQDAYALSLFGGRWNAGLAAFWWSHVPKARLREFLRGFHRVLAPGARVMFIDNAFVTGSSTPLSRTDAEGNTYQNRPLDDGSVHEVLKNFPTDAELHAAMAGLGNEVRIDRLAYFWVLSFVLPQSVDSKFV